MTRWPGPPSWNDRFPSPDPRCTHVDPDQTRREHDRPHAPVREDARARFLLGRDPVGLHGRPDRPGRRRQVDPDGDHRRREEDPGRKGPRPRRRHRRPPASQRRLSADRLHAAGPGEEPLLRAERLREHRLLRAIVRAFPRGTPHADRHAPEGDRARPVPGPAGREALGRHEAEGRALFVADPRPGFPHPRRAHHRRRSPVASTVLDARRQHPGRAAGDERPRLHGLHG